MKVEWPDLSFGPVNLYVILPAKEFYELMEEYGIPRNRYGNYDVLKRESVQPAEQAVPSGDT